MKETRLRLEEDVRPLGQDHRALDQQPGQPREPRLTGPERGDEEDLAVLLLQLPENPWDQREWEESIC